MSAPVFVKPNAIPRSHIVDAKMGWPIGTTLGRLCSLWSEHISTRMPQAFLGGILQALLKHFYVQGEDAQRLLAALTLENTNFLLITEGGDYEINGLAREIGKAQGRKIRAERANDKRWHHNEQPTKSKSKQRKKSSSSNESSKESSDDPLNLNHTEYSENAVFDPRIHVGQLLLDGEGVPDDKPPGSRVWDAYAAAHFFRYGAMPRRNAKTNSLCLQLVKHLDPRGAIDVVRFYLTHDKHIYISSSHDLAYCVKDHHALHTQMLTGRKVSSATAMEKDRAQGNIEAAQGAMDILMGRKDSILVTRD